VGVDPDGKKLYRCCTIRATNRSAADEQFGEWCRSTRAAYGGGSHSSEPIKNESATFGELLRSYAEIMGPTWTPSGRKTHAEFIDGYLLKLHRLPPRHVTAKTWNDFCIELLTKGGVSRSGRHTNTKTGHLDKPTIDRMETMVRAAFTWAIDTKLFRGVNPTASREATLWKDSVVEVSVADLVDAAETTERRMPEPWELEVLLDAVPRLEPDLHALVAFAASNGPRRGELLALSLSDWDASRSEMRIAKRLVGGDDGEVIVLGTKDQKRREFEPRIVPVDAPTAKLLDAHIEGCQRRASAAADPVGFGRMVRAGRLTAGLTQRELGAALGINNDSVSMIERGWSYKGRGTAAPNLGHLGLLDGLLVLDWGTLKRALAPNAFLFSPQPDGRVPWALISGSRCIPRLAVAAGLEPFGIQGIRRRVSSDLVAQGTMPKDLVTLQGHSYAVAIRYYTESTALSRAAAVARRSAMRAAVRGGRPLEVSRLEESR